MSSLEVLMLLLLGRASKAVWDSEIRAVDPSHLLRDSFVNNILIVTQNLKMKRLCWPQPPEGAA